MTVKNETHSKPSCHLLRFHGLPIFEQLQLEEALLRADKRNWCLMNSGSDPAIVMGISGKPELLINQERFSQQPIPLIKRFSGGGTVIVDSNTLFISWIFNTDHIDVPCCPARIHQHTETFYRSALPELDMQLVENDYVINGRKFGGNAQYLCKARWLHHSTLLWDYEEEKMHYLLMPAKTPAYRQKRPHHEFLCRLCDYLPSKLSIEENILKELTLQFNLIEIFLDEVRSVVLCPHRKATERLY